MKQISRKKWDQLKLSMQRFNAHVKQLPQRELSYERHCVQKMIAESTAREKREGRRPDGSLPRIPRKGVKRHGGVPRPEVIARQREHDRKRGAYESAAYLAANRSDEEE